MLTLLSTLSQFGLTILLWWVFMNHKEDIELSPKDLEVYKPSVPASPSSGAYILNLKVTEVAGLHTSPSSSLF